MAKRVLGRTAVVGFFVSLLVHLLTVAGIDVTRWVPHVWGLHVGMFVVLFAFVLSSRKILGRRVTLGDLTSGIPNWTGALIIALFVYGTVNLVWCAYVLHDGVPDIINGQYVLSAPGRVLLRITESEYHLHRAHELRMFSGLWLLAYCVSGLYFLFWREPASIFEGGAKTA